MAKNIVADRPETQNGRSNVISFEVKPFKTKHLEQKSYCGIFTPTLPSLNEVKQYAGVLICGLTLWGTSWFLFKDAVVPGGFLFNMTGVVIAGYIFGHTLERYTTINPVVGMTVIGALYRNLGPPSFLDNSFADVIDFHLRRIYPVIILTKGPLSWNWEYIKNSYSKVFSLATLPWIVECLSVAFFAHLLLGFPWYWGLHLGAILASVSPAVVVPTVAKHSARGFGTKSQIALLVGNAGGLDTAFTEGMFGIINSAIFYQSSITYRIVKAALAVFVGIAFGVSWGVLVDFVPDHSDPYAPAVRSLLIFSGGFLLTYAGGYFGWGGTSGVAIMVCAGAAATRWARRDWPINNNPVSEVYKVLWRVFEPMLFTLSGYYLEISQMTAQEFGLIVSCIFAALCFRLLTAFLVCLANELSVKESLFVAVTWIPKAIVEAVLVRVATDSLWDAASPRDRRVAAQHANIIVIAIIITSTLGSALTTILGPVLLSSDSRVAPEDKDAGTGFDNGVYTTFYHKEVKTVPELLPNNSEIKGKCPSEDKKETWFTTLVPVIYNYLTLTIIGLLLWGVQWCLWGEGWDIHGVWFKLALVAAVAWASGQALQALTLLPPLLAALLTGILARNLGFLDMNEFIHVDMFFRKLYPIVILGKGALAWDVGFMKQNWKLISTLGVLPWLAEVIVLAILVHQFLGFPLVWGFLLGSIYASVSCPVVMPSVVRINASAGGERNWAQLVCTAGGVDTALSVGVYGLIYSYIFYETNDGYRYTKAALSLFAGAGLGVAMGCVAGLIPHPRDLYVTELRILLVVIGGLLANMLTSMYGWGGTGGVAVLACNATAASFWARNGWKLNNNPAATAYRVMWSTLEPILFAYTGTFFEINVNVSKLLVPGFAILAVCLFVRLAVACLTCWELTLREKLFICCTWTPKSIVEAVLCPMALNTLSMNGDFDSQERHCAESLLRLIVQAILVTTPIGFLLTNHLGPVLLRSPEKDCEKDERNSPQRKSTSGSQSELSI